MAISVELHSDEPGGQSKTISLVKSGADKAELYIAKSDDSNNTDKYQLYAITCRVESLKIDCKVDIGFMTGDVEVVLVMATQNAAATVSISISHLIFGNGTWQYALRHGDDQALVKFLRQAGFPTG